MKWAVFKDCTIGEMVDIVQTWEDGQDENGAKEFVADVFDNVLFRFDQGSVQETLTDTLISAGMPLVWQQLAVRIARLFGAVLDAKPLAGLPF